MNLYVDIGNTRIKWALGSQETLHDPGALVLAATPDWVQRLPMARVQDIFVASVADAVPLAVLRAQAAVHDVPVHVVRTSARVGAVVNAYERPVEHGVDRWMACLAAHARVDGSVLIADAGTAVTLDWVGAQGRHGGGLITPGLAAMRHTLRNSTRLCPADERAAMAWLATDTEHAIATGTLRSIVALLDNAVRELMPDHLLISGGDAEILAPHLAHDWLPAPQLVLEGLAYYAQKGVIPGG